LNHYQVVNMKLIDLSEKIKELQSERQKHADAITAIDNALQRVSAAIGTIGDNAAMGEGFDALRLDLAGEHLRTVRRKGKFSHTAEVSVLEFVRKLSTPTTAQINGHWRAEGRCGTANVTILKLLQQGLIRRVADPAVRGSRYVATQQAEETQAAPDDSVMAH
jgi:hypothetical protein